MNVVISSNIKKTSERIDQMGNIINPVSKQIITPVEKAYVPPTVEPVSTGVPMKETSPLSIQDQIDEAKKNLSQLEELKQLKIKEMEAQLELLKK